MNKPFKRICRQLKDGSYGYDGNWMYLIHEQYAKDPQHYIRAYLVIQKDLLNLFDYVEPRDENLSTISFRIQELLIRICIEIEANFTAILKENYYSEKRNFNIKDFKLINKSHRLSSYKAKLPVWYGKENVRSPFKNWDINKPLEWYQAYNKSKHDRLKSFNKATFNNLIDSYCGLSILLSAQFYNEDYSPNEKGRSIGSEYSYKGNDGYETCIGDFCRILFPKDWPENERYDFDWSKLKNASNPFEKFDYNGLL